MLQMFKSQNIYERTLLYHFPYCTKYDKTAFGYSQNMTTHQIWLKLVELFNQSLSMQLGDIRTSFWFDDALDGNSSNQLLSKKSQFQLF